MAQKLSPDTLNASIDNIWSLIREASVNEARATSCELVQNIEAQINREDPLLLRALANACFACGYAISMNSRNKEALAAIAYYKQMEDAARIINDPILVTIALTYEGDTFRRSGNLEKARTYLQRAYDSSPRTDPAAHGNCTQLLGRVCLYLNDFTNFERLMVEAEDIAHTISSTENSTHGQYCLGTVYIEYARAYGQQKGSQKAMDYLDLAEKTLPLTPHWQTLLLATRADLLTRSGDIGQGIPLVVQSVELCYKHGNRRLLERIYALQHFLDQRGLEISKAGVSLSEALHGPFDL